MPIESRVRIVRQIQIGMTRILSGSLQFPPDSFPPIKALKFSHLAGI
jgi:hypothetical protein